ncbi:MAG: hypothetical protein AAGF75_12560, partial [Cyanobacteria bacterium P01_H01_bin.130]
TTGAPSSVTLQFRRTGGASLSGCIYHYVLPHDPAPIRRRGNFFYPSLSLRRSPPLDRIHRPT